MNTTGPYWWLVNIGSGNGLVSSGNKPIPEPVLTKISNAISRHYVPMRVMIISAQDVLTSIAEPSSRIPRQVEHLMFKSLYGDVS